MKKLFFLTAFIGFHAFTIAQNTEDEAIKKVILAETEAYFNRNYDGWRATWAHNPKVYRIFIANNYHDYQMGWDSADVQMERFIKSNPTPEPIKIENKNYSILQQGNMAWVHYDQWIKNTDGTAGNNNEYSKEYRVLIKDGESWKLAAQMTTFPETFDLTKPAALESNLINTGYALLQAKKTDEALEVMKMNVKLFPNSWIAFNGLGETYAIAGNKKMAIDNYEKSVKLNPKNEGGAQALAKLKTQK